MLQATATIQGEELLPELSSWLIEQGWTLDDYKIDPPLDNPPLDNPLWMRRYPDVYSGSLLIGTDLGLLITLRTYGSYTMRTMESHLVFGVEIVASTQDDYSVGLEITGIRATELKGKLDGCIERLIRAWKVINGEANETT